MESYFVDVSLGNGEVALVGFRGDKSSKYYQNNQRDALVGVLDRKTVVIWNLDGKPDENGQTKEPVQIPGWQVPILFEQFAAILFPKGEPSQVGPCKFYGSRRALPTANQAITNPESPAA